MNEYIIISGGTAIPMSYVHDVQVLPNPHSWALRVRYDLMQADLASNAECEQLMSGLGGWGASSTPEGFRERAERLQGVLRRSRDRRPSTDQLRILEELVEVKPLPMQGRQVHFHRDGLSLVAQVLLEKADAGEAVPTPLEVVRLCQGCGRYLRDAHPSGRKVRADRLHCSETCRKRAYRARQLAEPLPADQDLAI